MDGVEVESGDRVLLFCSDATGRKGRVLFQPAKRKMGPSPNSVNAPPPVTKATNAHSSFALPTYLPYLPHLYLSRRAMHE